MIQRHVVLSEMKPAMIGATVGAIGGPSENTAIALPRSLASHMSARTPAPMARGAPPPSPEKKRKTANCVVVCATAQAMLNMKKMAMETCSTITLQN
jgi:hypothetical protein